MSDLQNISVISNDDNTVSLLIDQQPISERYGMTFSPSIIEEISALQDGQTINVIDQFVFSHTDLNFEHTYRYVTSILKSADSFKLVKNFVYRISIDGQEPVEHIISKQGQPLTPEDVKAFIQAHIQKSLTDYTDLNYAY